MSGYYVSKPKIWKRKSTNEWVCEIEFRIPEEVYACLRGSSKVKACAIHQAESLVNSYKKEFQHLI